MGYLAVFFFFFKQKTAYEMRISDWSSDVCSSDLRRWRARAIRKSKAEPGAVGDVAPTYAIRVPCPFALPTRPLLGRGYAPDTRAVSEAVAPMGSACDLQIQSQTRSLSARLPALRKAQVAAVACTRAVAPAVT